MIALALLAVAAGSTHGLLLKPDATVWSWGSNGSGQLGRDGDDSLEPVRIEGLEGVRAIAAGDGFSLALKSDGTLLVWGQGGTSTPKPVSGLPQITAVAAAGHHSMALDAEGHVWTWGDEYNRSTRLTPVQVAEVSDIVAIAAGDTHNVALDRTGSVWVWDDHGIGDIGMGKIPGLADVAAIAAGYRVTIALKKDGTVWAVGYGEAGQLGDGTKRSVNRPVMVVGLGSVKAIAARYMTIMALKTDGTVWGWGSNHFRQLGDPAFSDEDALKPVRAANLRTAVAIAAGGDHGVAVTADGAVWNWGQNENGALGADPDVLRQSDVPMKPGTPIPPECRALFACGTASGKVIRICGTEDESKIDRWTDIHYRFGPAYGPPELMSTTPLAYWKEMVWFQNGRYRYTVDLSGGVSVRDTAGKVITNISCNERPEVYSSYLKENLPNRAP